MRSFRWNRIALIWVLIGLALNACALAQTGSLTQPSSNGQEVGDFLIEDPVDLEASPSYSLSNNIGDRSAVEIIDATESLSDVLGDVRVGYDNGFVIANVDPLDLDADDVPFRLKLNGWGQLRHSFIESDNPLLTDQNLFQLKRARLVFSGSAFTNDFRYFLQLDGRSSSGDNVRLLDYYVEFDVGRHQWGLDKNTFGFRTGRWKMPFTMARYLSGREFEFNDRSVSSMFFDVNRSLGWGIYGNSKRFSRPVNWELSIFNGLVTGGAETGSSGTLDDNFAYSGRVFCYPHGEWGTTQLADYDYHCELATRIGAGIANSTIDRAGETEFTRVRVVDSGETLGDILPAAANEYTVNIYSIDASAKYRGWSLTFEYYFRLIDNIRGAPVPDLFDHGHWMQVGKFIVPGKWQAISRWSRISGDSGTLGVNDESAEELAVGMVRYFREQHAKLTVDATYLDGAPISSAALDVRPGEAGWLLRTQIQFSF